MVQETDIVELELKSKRFSLSVRKKEALKAAEPTVIMQAAPAPAPQAWGPPPPAAPAAAPAAAAAAPAPAAPAAPAPPAPVDGVEVTSPMSGTLYRSPAPGEPPFVKEGDRVKKGQTVCIVEAMKLMNEIECDTDGIVVKLLVDNGGVVVPGTPLMVIKP
jgi:acetyl-CoA carboxylase biotin carboxyl carrier protein